MRTTMIATCFTVVLLVGILATVDVLGQDAEAPILEKAESLSSGKESRTRGVPTISVQALTTASKRRKVTGLSQ